MKIAFFLAEYPVLSETFIARQILGMCMLGHEVTIIAGRTSSEKMSLARAVTVTQVRQRPFPSLDLWRAEGRARLRAAVRAAMAGMTGSAHDLLRVKDHLGQFDAILAHFGPAGVRAMHLRDAGFLGGPLAVIFHGRDMSDRAILRRYLPQYRLLFRRADKLLPISRLWRRQLIEWGAPEAKTTVLRMGVDIARLPDPPADRPLQRPLRIVSVARLVDKKGLEYAIRGVKAARVPAQLEIVGSGPLEDRLRQMAAAEGNPARLLGQQPHARVLDLLAAADIFLLPSVTAADGDMEGVPVSLMEAMARGLVPISTRHSGIPELIEHGREGLLVDERNDLQIAAAIEAIAKGQVDIAAMRRAARAKVTQDFNNAALDRQLEEVLEELAPGSLCATPPGKRRRVKHMRKQCRPLEADAGAFAEQGRA